MHQLYGAILGEKNQYYYQRKFEQFDNKGSGLKASWNWPAFFAGGLWALYRKLYGWFFLLLGIALVSSILAQLGAQRLSAIVLLAPWLAFAIFANSLYQNNLRRKIAEARTEIGDETKLIEHLRYEGGVHAWVIWVFAGIPVLGVLAAFLIPIMFAGN